MTRRKYRQGSTITSLNELSEQEFVYLNGKITPRGWFMSWQIQMAYHFINSDAIKGAVKIERDKEKEEQSHDAI